MVWDTVPGRAPAVHGGVANYRSSEASLSSRGDSGAVDPATLVEPYAAFFAYRAGVGGNVAALIEGLLRLATCSAPLDAAIPVAWQDLARTGLTVAEDEDKQRMDCLFGLDGKAGLLGRLKRYRRIAADELPSMSSVQQAEFLDGLFALADGLLPGGGDVHVWSARSAALALPLYLQALGLIVLVQGWIGGLPGATEQAAMARHRAFITSDAIACAGDTASVLRAAAQALRG